MTYSELKEKAKELGLPNFGISKKELRKNIKEELAKRGEVLEGTELDEQENDTEEESTEETTETENNTPEDEETKKEEPKTPEKENLEEEPKYNAAIIVREDGHEVRRYTKTIHSDNFKELANQFAENNKHKVKLVNEKDPTICKNCGHVIED